ncbi:MAG: isochorismatase family protein [Deferrisomatales bacterium]
MGAELIPTVEDCFLVVVDVQPGLLKAYPPGRARRVPRSAAFAVAALGAFGVPAVLLALEPEKMGPVHPDVLAAAPAESPVVPKVPYDANAEPAFVSATASLGRPVALLAGVEAHVCVLHTALGLRARGFRAHYLADAVASRAAADETVGRRLLEAGGVTPLTAETLLFAWLGSGRHPRFPEVLPLLKARVRRPGERGA